MAFQKRQFNKPQGNSDYFRVTGMFHMQTKNNKKGYSGTPDRKTAEEFYEHLGNILEAGQVPRFTVWNNGDKPGALTCGGVEEGPKKGASFPKKQGYNKGGWQKKEEVIMDEPLEDAEDGYTVENA